MKSSPSTLPSFNETLIGQDFKERYDFECPVCHEVRSAAPSLFMRQFGLNRGGASCPTCKTDLCLSIDDKNERMVARPASSTSEITLRPSLTRLFP